MCVSASYLNCRRVRQKERTIPLFVYRFHEAICSTDVAICFCSLWSSVCFHICVTLAHHSCFTLRCLHIGLRKEVIQPQLPLQLPCYDFVPVTGPALGGSARKVRFPTSGVTSSHDVTGGVYKARERIHRSMADLRLLATPASCRRVAAYNPNYERL